MAQDDRSRDGREREKALDMALAQIDKQYGKGSIMRMGEKTTMNIESIPTGALSLDLALGIGGLPRGRVTEIFGPESSGKSTLAMHVVAEAQRNGGVCAYIDAEHAMDPVYARAIGVDIDQLLISQPDTGEQALEIADMLVRSGAIDVVVIDSVAALTPRAEIEGEMGDSHVGLQARLMSQALRKLTANLNKTNTIMIFINQLREKIGVMFGCMSYGTRVTLADGTQEKIGKIVNQRLPVEVLSYDADRDELVAKPVTNWFDNGVAESFLQFTVERGAGNGRAQFAATENHLVSHAGRMAAGRRAGRRRSGAPVHHRTAERLAVAGAARRPDGRWRALAHADQDTGRGSVGVMGCKQTAYADWKASMFANIGVTCSQNDRGSVFYDMPPLTELAGLREAVYVGGKKVLSDDYLKQLTPLSLAVWYLDDGSFTVRSKGLQERTAGGSGRSRSVSRPCRPTPASGSPGYLTDHWGLAAKLIASGSARRRCCSSRRLRPRSCTRSSRRSCIRRWTTSCCDVTAGGSRSSRCSRRCAGLLTPMPIRSITVKPPTRSMHKFDIEVDGTHNYFVDGVMVHNSPETTPGGRALKFYSSVRLDIRRIESLKDGTEVIGNRTRVKVVKNKVSPPFKQAEFDIMYGKGISREGSLLDMAVDLEIIKKSGAWFTYEGEQLGQGRENAKVFLTNNPEIMVEISDRVLTKAGLKGGEEPAAEVAAADQFGAEDDQPIDIS